MNRHIRQIAFWTLLAMIPVSTARAEVSFGADLVSRYIWRGTDFGDSVSAQPSISYSNDLLEVGAWSSWAISAPGANENDLYISLAAGPIGITLTDYFFPTAAENDFFNYSDDDKIHILEASAAFESGPFSLLGAFNFLGDDENSLYIEAGYSLGDFDGTDVGLKASLGNGVYTTDTDPMLVSLSVDLSRNDYFTSYILNPDRESTFLVFGRSF